MQYENIPNFKIWYIYYKLVGNTVFFLQHTCSENALKHCTINSQTSQSANHSINVDLWCGNLSTSRNSIACV